ncbi:hypothetical protein SAMN02910456_00144 [Ruminococcaceae bacterium YRB3002]|nr:hypothetical protein SAMN02910456_00144 [Ruminococcaceae bacterium YRB3002]
MRKIISVILIITVIFSMALTGTGCGSKADYGAPLEMYSAWKEGEDVTGKTVNVIANRDYFMGDIFSSVTPDVQWMLHINVEGDGAQDIRDGDEVTVKITKIDELISNVVFTGTLVE